MSFSFLAFTNSVICSKSSSFVVYDNSKKISSFSRSRDWKHAHNYVAKRYMAQGVGREVYFEDVRLQMDAKLWGEEFNRHNPPKKVQDCNVFVAHVLATISLKTLAEF